MGNPVTVIRDDDPAQAAELIIFQVHDYCGRVGIEPVPDKFSYGSDRLCLGLALQKIGLNLDGVIGHGD